MTQKPLATTDRPHVIVMPWPAQGHINPALQFSKKLVAKGLAVTLVVFTDKKLILQGSAVGSVAVELISDGGLPLDEHFLEKFRSLVEQGLRDFVTRLRGPAGTAAGPCCLVYDSIMPWALHVAKELGMVGAAFFTQPMAVNAVYLNVVEGRLEAPPAVDENGLVAVEGLSETVLLATDDLPSFVADPGSYAVAIDMLGGQFSTVREADWAFCNTFYSLEDKLLDWMMNKLIPIKSIGPTIPSAYLSNKEPLDLPKTGSEYGLNLFNPDGSQTSITQWLDSKSPGSVIYASMGSISDISKTQTTELALALQLSSRPFIWVVRESEEDKLPPDFLFAMDSSDQLVVSWCRQVEVLAHRSIGCFLTHCGWNSTMEALCLGVSMVALPVWGDQQTNAKFVADVWRVGARARADVESGVVTKEEIGRRIKEVMEGESGEEMRRNSEKWRKLAREAVADGGSSERNVDEFVASLVK
ncbi:unnamed protein product [Linum tenue]|uniref:Glycosyltransferase n=1 Tax=Linum tenue TaxID=586396 RepID=A0AAV0GP90_9ROSI|nr:unnamed protein product [Linum tenue]